jgi:hypothetical protein
MADGQVAAAAMDGEQETGAPAQQTSLRYLRLQNGFRNMLKSGLDRLDEQVGNLRGMSVCMLLLLFCVSFTACHASVQQPCIDQTSSPYVHVYRPFWSAFKDTQHHITCGIFGA